MSLHELLELEDGLHEALGRGLDLIVINAVYPERFTDAEVARCGNSTKARARERALHTHSPCTGKVARMPNVSAGCASGRRARAYASVRLLGRAGPVEYEHLARLLTP